MSYFQNIFGVRKHVRETLGDMIYSTKINRYIRCVDIMFLFFFFLDTNYISFRDKDFDSSSF